MVEESNQTYKPVLQKLKSHFVTLKAFLRIGCDAEIKGTRVVLANKIQSPLLRPLSLQLFAVLLDHNFLLFSDLVTKNARELHIKCGGSK